MFHAFTGCDTVSSFGGRGKNMAWATWRIFDDVTKAFCALAATPDAIDDWMEPLERFVVLLYDRISSQESVNQARKQLFTQKDKTIDGLPPTQAALIQHMKRAAYQAGHCWGQMMRKWVDGKFTGPHYQKQPRPVVNSSAVDARKDGVESANVSRQNLTALRFAAAVACVFITNIVSHYSM